MVLTLCYPFDYLRWLIGDVNSLWAFIDEVDSLRINVDAVAEIGMRFANGVIGCIHLDYLQKPNVHRLDIIGSNGKILWNYVEGTLFVSRGSDENPESYPLPSGFTRDSMFRDQMVHLRKILTEDEIVSMGKGA